MTENVKWPKRTLQLTLAGSVVVAGALHKLRKISTKYSNDKTGFERQERYQRQRQRPKRYTMTKGENGQEVLHLVVFL